ncbi:hypothetical protein J3R30DRAFT_617529 [Lentinula aciculospora]|uniref:Ankyrin n=1 Tax=Lentinula aciculospora TaxID=153920 RepID=A0A9W9A5E5_9AGAR|nr:hypothetical protein J3R30DRAFT_617529 [Lentinula aciculospora]
MPRGGEYGDALQAASANGNEAIVKLLIEKGVEINIQGGKYGNALQAVSLKGTEAIVKLLIEKGAEINIQGGKYGNALQAASFKGTVVMCYIGYGTYFIFPTSPPSLIVVTVWIHLHCSASFYHIPDTSINFPRCCLLI